MININLVRDRTEIPPTAMQRLSPALPVLLLVAYGMTLLLVFVLSTIRSFTVKDLKQDLKHENQLLRDVGAYRVGYSASDMERIETVRRIVELYSNKWHWGIKLAALQEALPAGVAISSFAGEAAQSVKIRAYAVDSDGKGLERITQFARNLLESQEFMEGIRQVELKRVFNPIYGERSDVVQFEVRCAVAS